MRMHKVNTILTASALFAPNAAATFLDHFFAAPKRATAYIPTCMADNDAQSIANNFHSLLSQYSTSDAEQFLTTDFSGFSDSVNTLIDGGCPGGQQVLGEATFTSRDGFEQGQGSQPPIPFEQLNLWHNCDTVFLRWRSGQQPVPVTGIVVLDCAEGDQGWEIQRVYSEFNSGAWLTNLGLAKSRCGSG